MGFYQFSATKLNGTNQKLEDYRGKVVIVVNTASKCGLTPQYEGLEQLYKKYKSKGLVILGFPCNQFANQELDGSEEIESFCKVNYGVTFPMFEIVKVNGKEAHPLFKFLKSKLRGWFCSRIKWNFTKFVIDREGNPVKRFAPTTSPAKMEDYICKILENK